MRTRRIAAVHLYYESDSPTVEEYCEKWLLMQSAQIRMTTLIDYTSKVKNYIIKPLGDMHMGDVTADDIRLALLAASKKSASVYKSVSVIYKCIFTAAMESKIIDDLLSLVKMDKSEAELNISQVNLNVLVEQILKRLRPIANRRKVELIFESIREVTADVDEMKLSLAITNLVENAIKYNMEEGWVRVTLDADHKFFYLKVQDSGIGIPESSGTASWRLICWTLLPPSTRSAS